MQLVLERRPERSAVIAVASPLIAVVLTIITFAILFAIMGKNPVYAIWVYFIEPLTDPFALQEIAVKATPLVMIAVGLALCYIANIWNIGAEGQFIAGAVCGSWLAVRTNGTDVGHWVLPAMLVLGALGGALYALIPAICRVYFGASEILTSLMLVYVANLGMDYLVRGPWRDPQGLNFPTTAAFDPAASIPTLFEGVGRLHAGSVLTLIAVMLAAVLLGQTIRDSRSASSEPLRARRASPALTPIASSSSPSRFPARLPALPALSKWRDRSAISIPACRRATASPPSSSPFSGGLIPSVF